MEQQQQQPPIIEPPPPATATRILPYIFLKTTHEPTRAELTVLALGALVVAAQLCRLVRRLRREGAFVHVAATTTQQAPEEEKEQPRKVAIVLPVEPARSAATPDDDDDDDDILDGLAVLTATGTGGGGPAAATLRFRLRGTGRRVLLDTRGPGPAGLPRGDLAEGDGGEPGAQASLGRGLELEPESELETGRDAFAAALTDAGPGSLGPEPATPTMLPLSIADVCENGGDHGHATELGGLGAPRAWRDAAADQAAMMGALLHTQGRDPEEGEGVGWAAPPVVVVGAEVDVPSLALGLEDPLGVNRLAGRSERDEDEEGEGREAVELVARDGGLPDV